MSSIETSTSAGFILPRHTFARLLIALVNANPCPPPSGRTVATNLGVSTNTLKRIAPAYYYKLIMLTVGYGRTVAVGVDTPPELG
jgi:hypothetical protein